MSIGGTPNVRPQGRNPNIEETILNAQNAPSDDAAISASFPLPPAPPADAPPRRRLGGINGCAAGGLIGLVLAIITIVILVNVFGQNGGSSTNNPSISTNSSGSTTAQSVATPTPVLTAPSGIDQSTVQNDAVNAYNSLDTSSLGAHVSQILDVMASSVFSSNQDRLTDDENGTGYVPSIYYYVDGCMDYIWRPNDSTDTAHWGQEELVVIYEWNYRTSAWEIADTNAARMPLDNESASCSNLPQIISVY